MKEDRKHNFPSPWPYIALSGLLRSDSEPSCDGQRVVGRGRSNTVLWGHANISKPIGDGYYFHKPGPYTVMLHTWVGVFQRCCNIS